MDGAKKNSDRPNTIAILTVGLTGAVLVYLSIIGIESWYLNESSAVDQVAKFGKQDEVRRRLKSEQVGKITEPVRGSVFGPENTQLYTIGINVAKALIVANAKTPDNFVPAVGRSHTVTIQSWYGRPKPIETPTAPVVPVDGATLAPGVAPTAPGSQPATPTAPTTGDVAPGTPGSITPAPSAPIPSGGR